MKKRPLISALISFVMFVACLSGFAACKPDEGYKKNPLLDTEKQVTLKIANTQDTWPELEKVITKFEQLYDNCTVEYEYIEKDYNENLKTRLSQSEDKIDLFVTKNIQIGKTEEMFIEYSYNLISDDAKKYLDLSNAHQGLVKNFQFLGAENTQYSIPYGGEMRGLYVNLTLLKKYGLSVPTNRKELLDCCEVLYENGYIPFHSPPDSFAQQLLYPYVCNMIANSEEDGMYDKVANIDDGISEYFRDAYSFLYNIVEKGYYDYKKAEEEYGYKFLNIEIKARDFLNIKEIAANTYEKQDDEGKIAFLTDTQAFQTYLDKEKSNYHSAIEYKFIVAPVGVDGGYGYLSPTDGVAVNKASDNIDWSLEFLNFLFSSGVNEEFANDMWKIPNTKDALLRYDVPENRACDVGQVTFNYGFYNVIVKLMGPGYDSNMVGIAKMNAPKYMTDNGDGTYSLKFTLDDYMARLEEEFQKVKQSLS